MRQPYWRLLPVWLARANGGIPKSVLNDVLWAQYCLYKAIRIQDDLFDGDAALPALIYVSDQFLIEAERVFARQFEKSSPFWRHYRHALRTTTQAIVEVDELQQQSTSSPARVLALYPQVNAIFGVGPLAVCLFSKRRHLRRLSRLTASFAVIGQLLDDFKDLKQDLDRKRYNAAALLLLRKVRVGKKPRSIPRDVLMRISQALLTPSITAGIFQIIYNEFDEVERDFHVLVGQDREALRYVENYRAAVEKLEKELHIQRMKFLLHQGAGDSLRSWRFRKLDHKMMPRGKEKHKTISG
jgi:hypothetical protein